VKLFSVSESSERRLLQQPESGMGYQLIGYRGDLMLVINATVAIVRDRMREDKFTSEDYRYLSGEPSLDNLKSLQPIQFDDEVRIVFSLLDKSVNDDAFIGEFLSSETATELPPEAGNSIQPLPYYRFSAYARDKRVDPATGNFLRGTYATTFNDLHFVPSGFAAVGRFALPNPAAARYVFQILTHEVPSLMGTAAPNFGQAGGGVEVLFRNGAGNSPGESFVIHHG
jgi:hypothetical protein